MDYDRPKRGLEKLKYYCQMCDRQCHDDNGFKCHQMSYTHKRKMEEFLADPSSYIENFSKEFESNFLELIQSKYPNILVLANKVYQDYISDQFHVHLNSTKWPSLDRFIKHLEEVGKCTVFVDKDKGTFLKILNATPESLLEKKVIKKLIEFIKIKLNKLDLYI